MKLKSIEYLEQKINEFQTEIHELDSNIEEHETKLNELEYKRSTIFNEQQKYVEILKLVAHDIEKYGWSPAG